MKQISFLIGSGFSIPEGISSANKINSKLSNINANDFYFGTDQSAGFLLPGQKYPNNEFEHLKERRFVEELIKFYNSDININKDFNYENFYDYIMIDLENELEFQKLKNDFFSKFEKDNGKSYDKTLDLYLQDFNKIFPQLIKSLVWKNFDRSHLCGPYSNSYPYARFFKLIEFLKEKHLIHIHTLNHDLLIERFNNTDPFQGEIDDGFTTHGSNLYGELEIPNLKSLNRTNLSIDNYYVRLPIFVGKFKSRFRLYKLHGSIDRYRLYYDKKEFLIKLLNHISPFRVTIEVDSEGGKNCKNYSEIYAEKVADFLTGTEYKITQYEDNFYSRMFEYMKNNLKNSENLIVVGYGFGDKRVNRHISQFFKLKDKKLIVIGLSKPNLNSMCIKEFKFFPGGVESFDVDSVISMID